MSLDDQSAIVGSLGGASSAGIARSFTTSLLRHGGLSELSDHEISSSLRPATPLRRAATTSLGGNEGAQPIGIAGSSREAGGSAPVLPSSFASFYTREVLTEDDGMSALRKRILDIQARDASPEEKARLVHSLLMEGYIRSRSGKHIPLTARPETPSSPAVSERAAHLSPLDSFKFWQLALGETSPAETFNLTEDDLRRTFVPTTQGSEHFEIEDLEDSRILGCEHYRRNVKLQCFTCQKWYTCRLCHNDAEDHILPRRETRHMLCMLCGHPQRASDECVKCGEPAAHYYCDICKLWNDDPGKSIYHCPDCGICRVGEGLGKDFVHCKVCLSLKL